MSDCRMCGKPLPDPAPTGRPRRYCGPTCRRLAEFAIRRIDRELTRLLEMQSQHEIPPHYGPDAHRAEVSAGIAARVSVLEVRLRDLFDEDDNAKENR